MVSTTISAQSITDCTSACRQLHRAESCTRADARAPSGRSNVQPEMRAYVDCKGDIRPAMRERIIAILVEELERVGVSARIQVPSHDEVDDDAPSIHDCETYVGGHRRCFPRMCLIVPIEP